MKIIVKYTQYINQYNNNINIIIIMNTLNIYLNLKKIMSFCRNYNSSF